MIHAYTQLIIAYGYDSLFIVVMCFCAQHACACDKFTWILFFIFLFVTNNNRLEACQTYCVLYEHTNIYLDGPSSILMRKSMRVEFIAQKRATFSCHFPSHRLIFNVIVHGNKRSYITIFLLIDCQTLQKMCEFYFLKRFCIASLVHF